MPPIGTTVEASSTAISQHAEWRGALDLFETEKKLQYEQAKYLMEQSRTYHTVVMGLAYGGFFAIWSAAKSITGENRLLAFSGAAMLISVSTFVLFTILNMYVLAKMTVKNARIAQSYDRIPTSPGDLLDTAKKIAKLREATNADIRSAAARVAILWPWFFYPSLISGMSAMLVLLYAYVRHA